MLYRLMKRTASLILLSIAYLVLIADHTNKKIIRIDILRNPIIVRLIGGALLLSLVLFGFGVFHIYQKQGISQAFTGILGSFVLAVITAWYAWITYRMQRTNRNQTLAARASISPKIRFQISPTEDGLKVWARNEGAGPARNIRLLVTVTAYERGIPKLRKYTYIGHVKGQLPPDETSIFVSEPDTEEVRPKFFVNTADNTFSNYTKVHGPVYYRPMVLSGMIRADTYTYLMEYLNNNQGASAEIPLDPSTLSDVVSEIGGDSPLGEYPVLDISVSYEDLTGTFKEEEELVSEQPIENRPNPVQFALSAPKTLSTNNKALSRVDEAYQITLESFSLIKEENYPLEENVQLQTIT